MKINFHRVLLGFFENWDKSPQKKWDKGELQLPVTLQLHKILKFEIISI